jgi:hypothetical protein
MNVRSKHLKLIGAAGAAALAIGTVATPALAAGPVSASVGYRCVALNGAATVHPTAAYNVAAPPTSLVAGQVKKLATTSSFTLNATDTGLAAASLGATAISGTIKTSPSNAGVGLGLSFPKTTLGNNTSDGSTTAHAAGNTVLRFTKAGSFTLKLGNVGKVFLQGYDLSGSKTSTASFPDSSQGNGPCKNAAGTTTLKDASAKAAVVTVTKDRSKTKTAAAYKATKHLAKGKAKVKGHFGLAGHGKVKFILKKGHHKVAAKKGKLNKRGVAHVKFKHVTKHGKYSITAKFAGDKALKKSSGKHTFKV